jgi:hypothetical protein
MPDQLIIEHMNTLPSFEEKLGQSPQAPVELDTILPVTSDDVVISIEPTKPKKKRVRKPVTTTHEKKRDAPPSSSSSKAKKQKKCGICKGSGLISTPVENKKTAASSATSSKKKPTAAAAAAAAPKKGRVSAAVAAATKQKEKELLYKVSDLRNLCREAKVTNFSRMNKGQMLEALKL